MYFLQVYFKELHILPLACICIWEIILFAISNLNNFLLNNFNRSYDTSTQNNLVIAIHNLVTCKNNIMYVGIKLYKISYNIREINTFHNFKSSLPKFLLKIMFHTEEEF